LLRGLGLHVRGTANSGTIAQRQACDEFIDAYGWRDVLPDRPALLDALRNGRLGGAALDALDPIPARDDALWTTPSLLITPKVSAYHPDMQKKFEVFAEAQLQRYLAGAPLEAVVGLARPG
jgi:phosphoglycerate dehydrogenase-like enzyme